MLERMKYLVQKLNEYSNLYYFTESSQISDSEFDALMEELKSLEQQTGTVLDDSPTHNVGAEVTSSFKPHTHISRLWSLDKVRTESELREWAKRCEKFNSEAKKLEFLLEYKFDGLTINLTYFGGKLVQAATRGNGLIGESILAQAKTINSIPQTVPYKSRFEVRGECYMRLSVLDELNRNGEETLKNARNAAAGAIRNLDPKITASRKLDCACYNIGYIDGMHFNTRREMYDFMHENGLPMSDWVFFGDIDQIVAELDNALGKRKKLDFLIDGLVIKLNNLNLFEHMGYTDKFPRGEISYKFPAEELVTVVNDITWEVGRTGKLTPLAHLEAVDFEGVTVKKATLNNIDDILRKNVGIGSHVLIRRSNDVIPEIIKSLDDNKPDNPIAIPKLCPACGAKVERRGVHAFCTNSLSCTPQIVGRLEHFASKNAMDIEGFSEKTAHILVDTLGVKTIPQIYKLTEQSFVGVPGFGEKRVSNLLQAIENSKKCKLDAFIFALGIPNVGSKTAKDLANTFGSFERIRKASIAELLSINDVGDIVASGIIDFFTDEYICHQIDLLLENGICPQNVEKLRKNDFVSGKTFVVTGTLERMGRKQIEDLIVSLGGKASGSVSKNINYLLSGENAGSKLDKARTLGITIISEDEFFKLIGE